ncbi:MAG: mechanosensitive ion channel [Candidatus Cloacimonadota bacterium]|nr:MAG: mechanosensitive ion channel [Candidatus Cloacimonadota bacterium]
MNPFIENIILSVAFPLLLIFLLLFTKKLLNRFIPFARTRLLYHIFSLSAGFFSFLLLRRLRVHPYIKQTGYAIFSFLLIALITRCLIIWYKESYIPAHQEIQIPFLLIDIIRWLILLAVLFIILRAFFNISLTGIFATSAVATAVIGFALQDILKNFFAGITLNMEIPFKRGDWIEIGGSIGEVVGMSWRATKIKTIEGNFVIVPNANIAQENIVNYSAHQKTLARYVNVGVHYRFPPKLVKDIIKEAVLSTEGVLKKPEPVTRLITFKDFSVEYQCKFWIRDYPNLYNIEDAVKSKIWYFFKENEIEIPFPIRTIYTHKGVKTGKKEIGAIVSLLEQVQIFAPLTKQEIAKLARQFILGYFARGEKLIHEGEEGSTFFIIKEGKVSVNVTIGDRVKKVKFLGASDFFGEMSLLTGEKRSATIIAEEETEVLILDREDFALILKKKPAIADGISKILALRKAELGEKTKIIKSQKDAKKKTEARSILKKIRNVFELKKRK